MANKAFNATLLLHHLSVQLIPNINDVFEVAAPKLPSNFQRKYDPLCSDLLKSAALMGTNLILAWLRFNLTEDAVQNAECKMLCSLATAIFFIDRFAKNLVVEPEGNHDIQDLQESFALRDTRT